jgi:hypothetical protein
LLLVLTRTDRSVVSPEAFLARRDYVTICLSFAAEAKSGIRELALNQLLARPRPSWQRLRIPVIWAMQTRYARRDIFSPCIAANLTVLT